MNEEKRVSLLNLSSLSVVCSCKPNTLRDRTREAAAHKKANKVKAGPSFSSSFFFSRLYRSSISLIPLFTLSHSTPLQKPKKNPSPPISLPPFFFLTSPLLVPLLGRYFYALALALALTLPCTPLFLCCTYVHVSLSSKNDRPWVFFLQLLETRRVTSTPEKIT